jgi:Kef-type K+ transport system membrane component KefB
MLLQLLVQIVVIMLAAHAAGRLLAAFGQPRVIGEMVAGLLLGPSLLGRVAPHASAQLFPAASLDLLNAFSQIGLVVFMFLVGLRLDSSHLKSHGRLVLLTSYTSMLLPFALGALLAMGVSAQFAVDEALRLPFVLFVGLSLSITAFPVLVRIVSDHGLTTHRLGTVAIACAAFDDATAWAALAVVTSLVRPTGISVLRSFLWLGVYVVVMILAVRPLIRWAIARLTADDGFVLALAAAIASAAVTEWLGIHPLFGSFFLGMLLARDVADTSSYAQRIEPLTLALFLPLFFAFAGLRTNVFLLTSPRLILETAIVLVIAVAGKAAGPLLIGRRLGFTQRESKALGVLLNTRGLVEIVVLNIGLDTGLLPPTLFAMLMLMALLTTAMTSPLLRRLGY